MALYPAGLIRRSLRASHGDTPRSKVQILHPLPHPYPLSSNLAKNMKSLSFFNPSLRQMVYYWCSLNVNGNWIDIELISALHREIVIKYNDEPVATGKLGFWSGRGEFNFVVHEDEGKIHYFVEIFPVFHNRAIGISVSRNGVPICVVHRDRRLHQQ